MRPFFPYYGSKWNTARYYPEPEHGRVVEPFAGSAGYSTFYEPENVLLVERDPVIAGVWAYLIRVSAQEVLSLPELLNVGDSVDNYTNLPQEARWLIGFWLNRGSAQPKKSRTAYSARTDRSQLNWGSKAKARIASQVERIRHWKVMEASYEVAKDSEKGPATWFVDPPYVSKGKYYRFSFWNFEELASWCQGLNGTVLVCENAGATWLPFRPLGSFKSSKGRSEEVLWMMNEIRKGEVK